MIVIVRRLVALYTSLREAPEGMVCLYGMLSALFVHHIYLKGNAEQPNASEDDTEVYRLSTELARCTSELAHS